MTRSRAADFTGATKGTLQTPPTCDRSSPTGGSSSTIERPFLAAADPQGGHTKQTPQPPAVPSSASKAPETCPCYGDDELPRTCPVRRCSRKCPKHHHHHHHHHHHRGALRGGHPCPMALDRAPKDRHCHRPHPRHESFGGELFVRPSYTRSVSTSITSSRVMIPSTSARLRRGGYIAEACISFRRRPDPAARTIWEGEAA